MSAFYWAIFSALTSFVAGYLLGIYRARRNFAIGFLKGRESAGAKLSPRKANELLRRLGR